MESYWHNSIHLTLMFSTSHNFLPKLWWGRLLDFGCWSCEINSTFVEADYLGTDQQKVPKLCTPWSDFYNRNKRTTPIPRRTSNNFKFCTHSGGANKFDIAIVISDCREATREIVGSIVNTFMPTVAGQTYNSNSPLRVGVFQVETFYFIFTSEININQAI